MVTHACALPLWSWSQMFNGISLLPNTSVPKSQFRAIILCGYGQDLFPLVEQSRGSAGMQDSDDSELDSQDAKPAPVPVNAHKGQIKALLPISGRKMIDWVLDRAEEAGLSGSVSHSRRIRVQQTDQTTDILVLAPTSISGPIEAHVRSRRAAAASSGSTSSSSSAKVDFQSVSEAAARKGPVQVLQWAAQKNLLTGDIVVLPCDLLTAPTDEGSSLSLASLLDKHRVDDNLVTSLFYERAAGNVLPQKKDGPSTLATMYDAKTATLLDVRDLDDYEDEIAIRTSMLDKCSSPTVSTSLLPAHVFIMSSLAIESLVDPANSRRIRHTETIRGFVAWLARRAWRKKGRESTCPRGPSTELALGRSTTQPVAPLSVRTGAIDASSNPQTGSNTPRRPPLSSIASSSAWLDPRGQSQLHLDAVVGKTLNRTRAGVGGCKIFIWRQQHGFIGRANSVPQYVECNRAAVKIAAPYPPPTNTPTGVFISPDCHIHPSLFTNLGEKVGIKRSIVGQRCIVGKGSKLTNVVLMDGVVIGENVKLDNCVLSNGVQVRDKSTLKDVEAGKDVIIEEESNVKNEQLVVEDDEE